MTLLAKLVAALCAEDQVVVDAAGLVQECATRGFRHVDQTSAAVLGRGLATNSRVELTPEVVHIAVEQAVRAAKLSPGRMHV
jgi:hypothetical protein